VGDGSVVSYEGRDYFAGGLVGVKRGDKVLCSKAVLAWNEVDRQLRMHFTGADGVEQCVIEKALAVDASGNYLDERLYRDRQDAAIDAQAEEREARLAAPMPAEAPRAKRGSEKRFVAPAARLVIRPASAMPKKRRTVAMIDLVKRTGREISAFEVASLGWGEAVSQAEIDEAVARFTAGTNEQAGGAAAMA
jgi:hypothetical protein